MYSSLIIQSSNFFLVFPFLIYNPFFLLLFLFEVSPLSLYVPSSSVVWFLLSLTGIFLLLPVLTPHLICALSNWSSPSYAIPSIQKAVSAFQLPVSPDRYVINSGCVVRTGYFYPNQS